MSRGSGSGSGQLAGDPGDHVVQFYAVDDELADNVSRYLAEGIRSGHGVVAVATAPHRQAFEAGLKELGVDAGAEQDAGRLLLLDAATLLASFLAGDRLDHDRFRTAAADVIKRAAGSGRPVRIYAEMVALLWDAGKVPLAIELEGLWNGLGAWLPFSRLCGYPATVLSGQDSGDAVRESQRLYTAIANARSFRGELDSVRAARHYVVSLLDPVADQVVTADAELVATELAANAVVHAHSGFTLTVSRSAAGIRIAVRDSTPLEPAGDIAFTVMPGHGLSVVAQLASRWAVEGLPDGKVVWVELSLAPPSVPPQQGS